ncbi:MAG: hypothetical protein NT076_02435 [Candidatus Pacearchaeota archaeon]|nr:hypothetical protein [Candidatus Pacearchaeota archaeon]
MLNLVEDNLGRRVIKGTGNTLLTAINGDTTTYRIAGVEGVPSRTDHFAAPQIFLTAAAFYGSQGYAVSPGPPIRDFGESAATFVKNLGREEKAKIILTIDYDPDRNHVVVSERMSH